MRDLFALSLLEAAQGIREGKFSSAEYTRSCLKRIYAMEERLLAWAWIDHERAIDLAEAADRQFALGEIGALHGIPVGVKDIIDVRGVPTGMGSPIYQDNVPNESAKVVRKFEQAGAFVMGKTVTAELAFLTPGKTRNPWNPAHTPGGSSMGSAAAVAAGFIPAALGTQTKGSVIRPAAFCGVVGYKPSQGTIANHGTLDYSPTLDQTGVFTRSVVDAAWLTSCLAEPQNQVSDKVREFSTTPKLAAVRSPLWTLTLQEQRNVFAENAKRLREAGADIVETELPAAFNQAHPMLHRIMVYEAAKFFRDIQSRNRDRISAALNDLLDEGPRIGETAYQDALMLRKQLQQDLLEFLRNFDAIITPPATGEAPATLENTGDPSLCTTWNFCGAPAISIPTALGPRGLPLGLQIVGRYSQDDQLLSVAKWCETQLPFQGLVRR